MSGLPIRWTETTISEITNYVQRGKGPKYSEVLNSFAVVNQKAIRWFGIQEEYLKYVDEATWDSYTEERFIRSGDILWNSTGTGTIGRACLLDEIQAAKAKVVDSHVTILRTNSAAEPRYLFYWIRSPKIQFDIESLSTGTTNQVELSKTKVLETRIPLAPINEQIRIADKLDSILAKVDRAQARLDKIPGILKRLRQSVLAAATSGDLTREWREENNLEISFKDYIFDDLLVELRNGLSTKPKEDNTGTPILRISAVRSMSVNQDDIRFLEITKNDLMKYKLKVDDLLFTRYNGSLDFVGVCGLIRNLEHDNLVYPDKLIRARLNDQAIPAYIEILFSSPQMRELVTGCVKTTSGQKGISGKDLKELPLQLPSIEEQKAVIGLVSELFSRADNFEKQYTTAKDRLNCLSQSVLAKAFRGELVTQNPNDEPVSELLKRIKSIESKTKLKKKALPKSNAITKTREKIAEQSIADISIELLEKHVLDLDAEKYAVRDNFRNSFQTEINKAQNMLVNALFTVEQFRSIIDFKGNYEELKALIMNLLKGIPNISEPLLTIESRDDKSGDYLMRLVKQK
ncbi:restriction endonuclease subunit S [Undibacterium curvum]|uniref:restriction endonuclease subunit S n=1 Tax=Undibacterium curvum TaxID=2762294 RepID=UPI003D14F466